MLTIRPEQDETFRQAALRKFEDDMVGHLKKFAPKHCEVIREQAVRRVIRLGIERAKQYGFTYQGCLRLYIELMFMFGSGFDTDPQLPWILRILIDAEFTEEVARAKRLHHETIQYLHRVAGPRREHSIRALRRISHTHLKDFASAGHNFETRGLAALRTIYPEKAAHLGDPGLLAVIRHGIHLAHSHGVSTEAGVAVFVGGAFAMGHRFTADPLFPWVSATLNDPDVQDANQRAARLETRMRTYLRRALEHLEQRQGNV